MHGKQRKVDGHHRQGNENLGADGGERCKNGAEYEGADILFCVLHVFPSLRRNLPKERINDLHSFVNPNIKIG